MGYFTNKEQSEKLRLLLDSETADFTLAPLFEGEHQPVYIEYMCDDVDLSDCIPCWTAGKLMDLMPMTSYRDGVKCHFVVKKNIPNLTETWFVGYEGHTRTDGTFNFGRSSDDLMEALVDLVEWCVTSGLMPEEHCRKGEKNE